MTRNYSEAQENYLKAQAFKETMSSKFMETGTDEDADNYTEAITIHREAEEALVDWALAQVKELPQYAAHAAQIERVCKTRIPSIRTKLVKLCLSLQV